mmetsp:Transcript_20516/g.30828  ORF Transcript_20516/g.30828 Transcript_20516/m.30828 type:complete len:86 (+) Transcript_20516:38-295(+)
MVQTGLSKLIATCDSILVKEMMHGINSCKYLALQSVDIDFCSSSGGGNSHTVQLKSLICTTNSFEYNEGWCVEFQTNTEPFLSFL